MAVTTVAMSTGTMPFPAIVAPPLPELIGAIAAPVSPTAARLARQERDLAERGSFAMSPVAALIAGGLLACTGSGIAMIADALAILLPALGKPLTLAAVIASPVPMPIRIAVAMPITMAASVTMTIAGRAFVSLTIRPT
jgi:hypothetical protein